MAVEMIKGRYGEYGGTYVPEMLVPALQEVDAAYEKYRNDSRSGESWTLI